MDKINKLEMIDKIEIIDVIEINDPIEINDHILIKTLEKIIELVKLDRNSTLSTISSQLEKSSSKSCIWKHYKMKFSQFLKKFPDNFSITKGDKILIISDKLDVITIMEQWNKKISDQEELEAKYGRKLSIYKLPENLKIFITRERYSCNEWIEKNIYDYYVNGSHVNEKYGSQIVGIDTETTIDYTVKKPSLMQLAIKRDNEYHCLIIQLALLNEMPENLARLLSDKNIIKTQVGITNDIEGIQLSYEVNFAGNCILSLDKFTENLVIYKDLIQYHTNESYGLKDMTAIILDKFLPNKGYSKIKNTEWRSEQLSNEQIEYSLADVCIVLDIYDKLVELYNANEIEKVLKETICSVEYPTWTIDEKRQKTVEKANNKTNLKKIGEDKKKAKIYQIINKWVKDDDNTVDLALEPMNSFYRKYVHDNITKFPGITSSTVGIDPNRYVILHKHLDA